MSLWSGKQPTRKEIPKKMGSGSKPNLVRFIGLRLFPVFFLMKGCWFRAPRYGKNGCRHLPAWGRHLVFGISTVSAFCVESGLSVFVIEWKLSPAQRTYMLAAANDRLRSLLLRDVCHLVRLPQIKGAVRCDCTTQQSGPESGPNSGPSTKLKPCFSFISSRYEGIIGAQKRTSNSGIYHVIIRAYGSK